MQNLHPKLPVCLFMSSSLPLPGPDISILRRPRFLVDEMIFNKAYKVSSEETLSIFRYTDYRDYMRIEVTARKRADASINFQNMAARMRIQKPFLSKVVNG